MTTPSAAAAAVPTCLVTAGTGSAGGTLFACPVWMYATLGGVVGVTIVVCFTLLCFKPLRKRVFPFRDRKRYERVGGDPTDSVGMTSPRRTQYDAKALHAHYTMKSPRHHHTLPRNHTGFVLPRDARVMDGSQPMPPLPPLPLGAYGSRDSQYLPMMTPTPPLPVPSLHALTDVVVVPNGGGGGV